MSTTHTSTTLIHQQNKHNYPISIINTISHIGNIYFLTKHKKPKMTIIQYHTWNNSSLILLHGDIELNSWPLSTLLHNLPHEYTRRQKQYFIPNFLTLQPQYAHLEALFTLHLSPYTQNQELPHLQRHISLLPTYPIHHHRYPLIIIYSPIPHICNQQMAHKLDPRYLTILRRLHKLPREAQSCTTHITTYPHYDTTRVVYCVVTEGNPDIMSCRHDIMPDVVFILPDLNFTEFFV